MNKKRLIINIVVGVAFVILLVATASYIRSLPTVYFSYSTQECVKVEDPAGKFNCENPPKKYHHVWVA